MINYLNFLLKSADILRQTPKQADVRKFSDEQKQSNVKVKDNSKSKWII